MELNLFSLKVFLKIIECDGFTPAAKCLCLSQPAVTSQIQNLETYLGTSLFLRSSSGKPVLSDAGQTLREHAERIVELSNDLLFGMEKYTHKPLLDLHVGACFTAGGYLLPPLLKAFEIKGPGKRVTLSITQAEKVFEGVAAGKMDLGVTGREFRSRYFSGEQIAQVPMVIFQTGGVVSGSSPLKLKELRSIPLITREAGAGCRVQFQEFLLKYKEKINNFKILAESESNEAIKNLVKSGHGFSVMPEFMVRRDIEKGLFSEIRLEEGQPMQTYYIFYRKGNSMSQTQREFFDFILRSKEIILNALYCNTSASLLTSEPYDII
jgi:DNA-binding transcriptional LysR family regulator